MMNKKAVNDKQKSKRIVLVKAVEKVLVDIYMQMKT